MLCCQLGLQSGVGSANWSLHPSPAVIGSVGINQPRLVGCRKPLRLPRRGRPQMRYVDYKLRVFHSNAFRHTCMRFYVCAAGGSLTALFLGRCMSLHPSCRAAGEQQRPVSGSVYQWQVVCQTGREAVDHVQARKTAVVAVHMGSAQVEGGAGVPVHPKERLTRCGTNAKGGGFRSVCPPQWHARVQDYLIGTAL